MSRFACLITGLVALSLLLTACTPQLEAARIDTVTPGSAILGDSPLIRIEGKDFYTIWDYENQRHLPVVVEVCGAPLLNVEYGDVQAKTVAAVPAGTTLVLATNLLTGTLSPDAVPGVSDVVVRMPLGKVVTKLGAFTCRFEEPVASFTMDPVSGLAPLSVAFDATASVPGTGEIASYSWDFGDGSAGVGRTVSHEFLAAGDYTVSLTVTDSAGGMDTVSRTVSVGAVPVPTISVNPATAVMLTSESMLFTADLTHIADESVNWTVSAGSLADPGANPVTFTAPAAAGTVTLTATSVSQPDLSAIATITVNPLIVTITPTNVELFGLQQQTFTAVVTGGTDTSVSWAVSGGYSLAVSGNQATFTAPDDFAGTVQVAATSVEDTTQSATATVNVKHFPLLIGPSSSVVMVRGENAEFESFVDGERSEDVTWVASGGIVAKNGNRATYTAPDIPGTYTVTLRSSRYPGLEAVATILVKAVHTETSIGTGLCLEGLDTDGDEFLVVVGQVACDSNNGSVVLEYSGGSFIENVLDGLSTNNVAVGGTGFYGFEGTLITTADCAVGESTGYVVYPPKSAERISKNTTGCFINEPNSMRDVAMDAGGVLYSAWFRLDRIYQAFYSATSYGFSLVTDDSFGLDAALGAPSSIWTVANDRVLIAGGSNTDYLGESNSGGEDALVTTVRHLIHLPVWTTVFGGPGNDRATDVTLDANGDVIAVGRLNMDSTPEMFVAKLAEDTGDVIWQVTLGNTDLESEITAVTDDQGNIYIAGALATTTTSEPTAMVIKLDNDGNRIWLEDLGAVEPGSVITTDIALYGNDQLVVAGSQGPLGTPDYFITWLNRQ